MHFYRSLAPIKAMAFDLDDTLYDNRPVIEKTEQEVLKFVRQFDPRFSQFSHQDLYAYRDMLLEQEPEIFHDVTQWRWRAAKMLLSHYGYNSEQAIDGADKIMANFAYWRSQISIADSTHSILSELMLQLPLVAITNGNSDPQACGLDKYFQFVLKAGPDGRSKPNCDMYSLAASRLNIPVKNILHVGDSLLTDVEGAIRSGMQACWLNLDNRILMDEKESRLLPHIEISNLASLLTLL